MNETERRQAQGMIYQIIRIIGDDPERQGLKETPARVVRSWEELYGGYEAKVADCIKVFETKYDQVVVLRGIDYFSMCEHHMLPFYGKAYIAYLPNGEGVLGVSKLARIVEVFARRLQIQEQMTRQIADAIEAATKPKGVAVVVDGTHLCMMARGVQQQHATMRTSYMAGLFRDNIAARNEVLTLMGV